jgi:hypothetical protein
MIDEVLGLPHSSMRSFALLGTDGSDSESEEEVNAFDNSLEKSSSEAFNIKPKQNVEYMTIGGITVTSVDVSDVETINPTMFRDRYRMRRPVIIRAGASTWNAVSLWADPDTFMAKVTPNCGVTLVSKDNKNFLLHELCDVSRVSLHDALREILSVSSDTEHTNCKKYSRMYLHEHPHLHEDVNLTQISNYMSAPSGSSSMKADLKLSNCGVWASSQGCETPLHYDICHGFLCQIG